MSRMAIRFTSSLNLINTQRPRANRERNMAEKEKEKENTDHEQYLTYLELALEEAENNGVLPYALEMAWNDYKESKGWK